MPITRLANRLTTSIVILIIILGTLLFTYVYFMSDIAGPVSTNQSNVSTWVQLPSFMKSTTRSYDDPFGPLILEASNPSQPGATRGATPAAPINITDEDVKADIAKGLYSEIGRASCRERV